MHKRQKDFLPLKFFSNFPTEKSVSAAKNSFFSKRHGYISVGKVRAYVFSQ